MATIGQLTVSLVGETSQFTQSMEKARVTTSRLTNTVAETGKGLRKFENAAVNMGLSMVGVTGKTAKMTEGLLLMGVGGPVTLALVAGVGIIIAVYNSLTSATKKAKEANEKLIDSLRKTRAAESETLPFQVEAATKRATALRAEIAKMERSPMAGGRYGAMFTPALEAKRRELAELDDLIKFGSQKFWEDSQDKTDKSTKSVVKHTEAVKGAADMWRAFFKWAGEAATETERMREVLRDLDASWRARQSSQIDDLFEKAKAGTASIKQPVEFDKMLKDAELWQQTWENGIRGVQDAFADMFENIGREGWNLVSVFENIARAIQRVFAQYLSQQLTNAIFSGGIPGAPDMGNIGDSLAGAPTFSRAPTSVTNVNQSIAFNTGFVDGATGEAWLQSKAGTIATVVAQAASDAPHFARHIVASGMR